VSRRGVADGRNAVAAAVLELRERNRVLFWVTVVQLGLAVAFTALMALDGRTLLGRNVWTKPWKFATSIAVFTATLGWVLPSLSLTARVERGATAVVAGAMTTEIALIATQAARGVASHFNTTTPLDATVFLIMGATITANTVVVGYVLWRTLREPPPLTPAYLWGLRLGMAVFVAASLEGWVMIGQGSHAVGAPVDGAGRPLLNWSLVGGDLRVAHFIGLHSLQVLPLTGYVATRWLGPPRRSLAVVGAVAALYAALVGATFVQAVRGRPFLASLTLPSLPASAAAAALLIGVGCGAAALVAWRGATP